MTKYISVSQPFLPSGTLDQQYQYFAAPQGAKIGLKVNESEDWWHP